MHVSRLGLTPLKGARHVSRDEVALTRAGAVGDRVLCLVDPVRERVLRTVEHPELPGVVAVFDGAVLRLVLPDGREVADLPLDSGIELKADYWGRPVLLRLQSTVLSDVLSDVVGAPVRLALAEPGDVVYGESVSIVTTTELAAVSAQTGLDPVDLSARSRSTFTVDDTQSPIAVDALLPGTLVSVGAPGDGVDLEVRGRIPRCAVVDIYPVRGGLGSHGVLKALPVVDGEPTLGFDARVVRPGVVHTGDPLIVGVG